MVTQSATSISDFKFCPMLFNFRHVLRLRPVETPEPARIGTNWHKCLEILKMTPGDKCFFCHDPWDTDGPMNTCPICEGTGQVPDDLHMALTRYMNLVYSECPPSIDLTAWEVERTILLYSAIGWAWHWADDKIESVAREVPFRRKINNLYTRQGRLDQIVRRNKLLSIGEYKSTSKPIDPQSVYWDRLNLDTQPTLYLIEGRYAQLADELEQYGILATDPLISGVLYDVWHRPLIKPKKLSQADTKKFTVDGKYFGETFEITWDDCGMTGKVEELFVNDTQVPKILGVTPKATTKNPDPSPPWTIRETPEMFGARLLADIRENPDKHFARRDITRTDSELAALDIEYENISRLTHFMEQRNLWYRNEKSCNATYRCAFMQICGHNQEVSEDNVPAGFCIKKD